LRRRRSLIAAKRKQHYRLLRRVPPLSRSSFLPVVQLATRFNLRGGAQGRSTRVLPTPPPSTFLEQLPPHVACRPHDWRRLAPFPVGTSAGVEVAARAYTSATSSGCPPHHRATVGLGLGNISKTVAKGRKTSEQRCNLFLLNVATVDRLTIGNNYNWNWAGSHHGWPISASNTTHRRILSRWS
jgi:hypothetical protein